MSSSSSSSSSWWDVLRDNAATILFAASTAAAGAAYYKSNQQVLALQDKLASAKKVSRSLRQKMEDGAATSEKELEALQTQLEATKKLLQAQLASRDVIQSLVGKPAPYFKADAVINGDMAEVSLEDYSTRYLVLLFYPGNFNNEVCRSEILTFNERLSDFEELDTAVVAISTDSKYSHLAWCNKSKAEGGLGTSLALPLVSDTSHAICKDYGVEINSMGEGEGAAYHALFIISNSQIVRQSTVNDVQVGKSVSEVIRTLHSFKHSDETGDGIPAEWYPGQDGVALS